ncbi:alpha-l-rhamnosidase [Grosmannia clavigera kw1407]|uniref:Alpha-l-rhamnosidase n=1 Tax=Grosmannia clavigera (strain kw1407 / UAMH 11150) TaxID=655863 RepID=F0XBI6_GROCL|nr:alpha-l-rhamnosidase [Grosmannia clavigera kw1407]EFX04997.1 alpha-l-rhamnosidase [Grosmannia clavigera kw1407]
MDSGRDFDPKAFAGEKSGVKQKWNEDVRTAGPPNSGAYWPPRAFVLWQTVARNRTFAAMAASMLVWAIVHAATTVWPEKRRSSSSVCWRNTTCSNTITEAAFRGEWEANMYAPASRTVEPVAVILSTDGDDGDGERPFVAGTSLAHNGSMLVFDFGKEVGGIVHLDFVVLGNGSGAVGLAFSEARNWIGEWSDSSSDGQNGRDGALYANFSGPGSVRYTMPDAKLRGGFRYLSVFLMTATSSATASVQVDCVQVEIAFQPTWTDLRAYQGYFHSDDALLNRIWYSCAYTLQTNLIPPNTGRTWPPPQGGAGWSNDGNLGSTGNDILVDGAKRDRAVWTGDLGVAVPAAFVSLGDLEGTRNALQTIYDHQNGDGAFPQAGPPLLIQGSDAYHLWTLIGTYNYILYTGDATFLDQNWPLYMRAVDYIWAKVTPAHGLLLVTGSSDWARQNSAGEISEAQMLLYHALQTGCRLAGWAGDDTGLAETWTVRAKQLRQATITHLYNPGQGAFMDSITDASIYPQDANALAVLFGVVTAQSAEAQNISALLAGRWTSIGAPSPELPGNVSPFISSLEILAHIAAGHPDRAVDLIRISWGWYLQHPNGTQSTAIEGYLLDGSFGYRTNDGYRGDHSYPSHSHGWSTGPATALTEGVLGLQVTARQGRSWIFAPQMAAGHSGRLHDVQGGFVTGLGSFQARWWWQDKENPGPYQATVHTPDGTTGQLLLPVVQNGTIPTIQIDGQNASLAWYRQGVDGVVDLVATDGVLGGNHTIKVW